MSREQGPLSHNLGCEVWLGNPCCCRSKAPPPVLDEAQRAWAESVRRKRERDKPMNRDATTKPGPGFYWLHAADGTRTIGEREDGGGWSVIGSDCPFTERDGSVTWSRERYAIGERIEDKP